MKFTYPSGSRPLEGYTIKRGVGRGGFGEVYYATSDGGKEVALKHIRRNLDVELRGVQHCLNLKHQNLIGLFDIREDENEDSWVVMEFVRGESLEDAVGRHPHGMLPGEALRWFRGVAAGVGYLHDQGIVHRDLKPGNIFDDEGVVKIGDYGLSKFISSSRRSGQTESVGTVHYMAPEVANGRYGKEIDIYALGILLFELLTGRVPFEGESVGEVLMKHLTAEPELSSVSEPYRGAIARALSKDPGKRFRSVNEFLAALPGGVTGAPGAAVPPATNGAQPRGPKPKAAAAAGAPSNGTSSASVGLDNEPIWLALREAAGNIQDAWNNSNMHPAFKVLLIIFAVIVPLMYTTFIWVPAVAVLGISYLIYFVIRALVLAAGGTTTAASPPSAVAPPPPVDSSPPPGPRPAAHIPPPMPPPRRRSERIEREKAMTALPLKPTRQKFMELLGSMLVSAGVATAMAVVLNVVAQVPFHGGRVFWLAAVGTAGAWGVLIPAKFWEGTHGEPVLRRFVLLCVGLALGLFAFALSDGLGAYFPVWSEITERPHGYQKELMEYTGANVYIPSLAGCLAYFGFLFPILRWWRQADPLRWSRFSLFSVVVCVFWAGMLNLAWPFPQPWGMMAAATIAISVQLSAPWFDEHRRFVRHVV